MNHAVPVQLRDQKLVVAVEDSLWKKQLEHMRGQLLLRLNSVLGQSVITAIDLRIDPATVAASRAATPESRKERSDFEIPAELLGVAAEIDNVELRRAFLGAASSCIRRVEKG